MILGCLKENYPSRAFYEKMGGKIVNYDEIDLENKSHGLVIYEYDILCKNNILTLSGSKVKELQKLFSCLKNLFFHRISCPVSSPVHIHSRACQVIINCLCNRWCLWKRRTGLIQIDFIHK